MWNDPRPTAGPYSTITNVSGVTFTNTGLVNGTTYYYVVTAVNAGGQSANSSQVSAAPSSSGLPSPWQTADVWAVGTKGSAAYTNVRLFTVQGFGANTWSTADAFRYVYQSISSNCVISAKVLSVSDDNSSSKGGVMIRGTLASNSVDCLTDIMATAGAENIWRTNTGGNCTSVTKTGVSAPYWVQITRTNNVFIGYLSTNGTTWTAMSTNSLSMVVPVHIGLFVCARTNNASLCTATFTNVVVSP